MYQLYSNRIDIKINILFTGTPPMRQPQRLGTSNQYNACLPAGILVDFKTPRTLNQARLLNQGRSGPDSKTVGSEIQPLLIKGLAGPAE